MNILAPRYSRHKTLTTPFANASAVTPNAEPAALALTHPQASAAPFHRATPTFSRGAHLPAPAVSVSAVTGMERSVTAGAGDFIPDHGGEA